MSVRGRFLPVTKRVKRPFTNPQKTAAEGVYGTRDDSVSEKSSRSMLPSHLSHEANIEASAAPENTTATRATACCRSQLGLASNCTSSCSIRAWVRCWFSSYSLIFDSTRPRRWTSNSLATLISFNDAVIEVGRRSLAWMSLPNSFVTRSICFSWAPLSIPLLG
jgi:hypothetical protein